MEKNQYKLCLEILKRLNEAGVLKDIMLIGSWCLPFYREYFSSIKYAPTIRTRDVDLLVPSPQKVRARVDIPALLKDLGFIENYSSRGYIKLEHPDLAVEFLSPEKGRGMDEPVPIPQLGVNAQALRYLSLLTDHTIRVDIGDFNVCLPHPVYFAFHKLIVSQLRSKKEKADNDKEAAISVLRALISKGDSTLIKSVFDSIIPAWRRKILKGLGNLEDRDILKLLMADPV